MSVVTGRSERAPHWQPGLEVLGHVPQWSGSARLPVIAQGPGAELGTQLELERRRRLDPGSRAIQG